VEKKKKGGKKGINDLEKRETLISLSPKGEAKENRRGWGWGRFLRMKENLFKDISVGPPGF